MCLDVPPYSVDELSGESFGRVPLPVLSSACDRYCGWKNCDKYATWKKLNNPSWVLYLIQLCKRTFFAYLMDVCSSRRSNSARTPPSATGVRRQESAERSEGNRRNRLQTRHALTHVEGVAGVRPRHPDRVTVDVVSVGTVAEAHPVCQKRIRVGGRGGWLGLQRPWVGFLEGCRAVLRDKQTLVKKYYCESF